MKPANITGSRLAKALDLKRWDYVGLYLFLGVLLLLKDVPEAHQDTFFDSFESGDHALQQAIALVEAYLDAGT